MKFGTRTQVLKQPAEGAFHVAQQIGFDGLEFDLARDYKNDILWTKEGRRRLLDLAKETGVEVASVCLGALWGHPFGSEDPETRARAKEIVTAAARFTPELGAKVILVPIAGEKEKPAHPATEHWIDGLRVCAPAAEASGAILALENVGTSPVPSANEVLGVIEAVGSPAVRAYYDVGNGMSLGFDPLEDLRLLQNHLAQVHIKGARAAQLWENTIDMAAVTRTLHDIGYDGYLVFETRATDDPAEGARRNLEILRQHVQEAYGTR